MTKKIVMKIDVPANSMVTKDMIVEDGEQTKDDQRKHKKRFFHQFYS